jgi:hypothetical protein
LIPLIDLDHNLATYGSVFELATKGPDALANVRPQVQQKRTLETMGDEPFLGMLWNKSLVYEYVKPFYKELLLSILDILGT